MKIEYKRFFITIVVATLFAINGTTQSTEEQMKSSIQNFVEALNDHNIDQSLTYTTNDIIYDFVPMPPLMVGKEEIAGLFEQSFEGIPDWHGEINWMLISGNVAVIEFAFTGTHLGNLVGIPATGQELIGPSLYIWEFSENQINKITEYMDMGSVLSQMGVIPSDNAPPLIPSFDLPASESNSLTPKEVISEMLNRQNDRDFLGMAKFHHDDEKVLVTTLENPLNRSEFIALTEMFSEGFPDLYGDVVRTIELNDGWVLQERIYNGTHTGSFLGMPPTGRFIQMRTAFLCQVGPDGLIRNMHVYYDNLSLLGQLTYEPIGIFDNHRDIGDIAAGEASYNDDAGEYMIKGSDGSTSDMVNDYFHFVYSEVNGDFRIQAKMRAENLDAIDVWGMAGIIVKDDLSPEALTYLTFVRTDLNVFLVRRRQLNNAWESLELNTDAQNKILEIVRKDNSISMYSIDDATGERIEYDVFTIEFEDPVYVGLLVRSWEPEKYTIGYFTNVVLENKEPSSLNDWDLYK